MCSTQPRCFSLVLFTSGLSWNKRVDANPTGSPSISTLIIILHTTTHTHPHAPNCTHLYSNAASGATKHTALVVTAMQRDRGGKRKAMEEIKRCREGSCFPPTSCCLTSASVLRLHLLFNSIASNMPSTCVDCH